MGSSHSHVAEDVDLGTTPRNVLTALVALIVPLVLATGVGLLVLWPDQSVEVVPPGYAAQRAHGTVLDVHPCELEVRAAERAPSSSAAGRGPRERSKHCSRSGSRPPSWKPVTG